MGAGIHFSEVGQGRLNMRALASYIMRGPVQATLVTAAFALTSLIPILGLLSILSGAAVALVTLRQGAKQGITVVLGASLVAGIFMYFVFGSMLPGLLFAVLMWLPLWGLSLVLRTTSSWSILLDAVATLGILVVAAFYIALGEPAQLWQQVLAQMLELMSSQGGMAEMDAIQQQIPSLAEWMTGLLAGAMVIGLIASMLLARWWQALLYNPGGFRQEFHALRQSKIASLTVLLILVVSKLGLGKISTMAGDIMIIAVMVYSVVGLALVHALVARTVKHVGFLVALYVLLFIIPPHVMLALASAAFADSWMDFRGRLALSKKSDNNDRHDNQ